MRSNLSETARPLWAIVPARGGSKGLPRKNLRLLNGRPLIRHTIDAARAAALVCGVLVSTDDEEIASEARAAGADVPFLRPGHLALDETPAAPVVAHAIAYLEQQGARVDAIVLLQPTSPLRRAEHVDAAIQTFFASGADTVVSVCEVEHSPYWMYRLESGLLRPFMADDPSTFTRRQQLPVLYRLNGAIYVTSRHVVIDEHRIVGDTVRPLVMSADDSVDIDHEHDLERAEWLAQRPLR
jgi:CMP-N,N'-diacetyllegionaminic acid synthase